MMQLIIGQRICSKTHAIFLNTTFDCQYKKWMKSTWEYNDTTTIWMIRIDNENRYSYQNYFDGDFIVEYSKEQPTRSEKPVRMVFQIIEENGNREYVYLGKYTLDQSRSNAFRRFFRPLANFDCK